MFKKILAKRQIEKIRLDLIQRLGVPEDLVGSDRLKVKFSVRNRENAQVILGASYTINGLEQKMFIGSINEDLVNRTIHELGHYIYFNVAGKGDPKKREEFFIKFHKNMKELQTNILSNKGNYQEQILRAFRDYSVITTLYESFACFCSFLYDENNFSEFEVLKNCNNEAYQSVLSLSNQIFNQPDASIVLNVLENLIPEIAIPEHKKEAINNDQYLAANTTLEGMELIGLYAHSMGEYIGSKMYQLSKSKGVKEVSDMVFGIGAYTSLPPEMRIGTEKYYPRVHLAYLHDNLSPVRFEMPLLKN